MDWILNQISHMDVGNLIAMAGMFWIFNRHINTKFESLKNEISSLRAEISSLRAEVNSLRAEVNSLRADVNSLKEQVQNIDKRLVAVETTIRIQGGCRLNYDHSAKHID
ncbi:MAG: coiled-coil domain-containing protein [Nitrosopumilus sp.]